MIIPLRPPSVPSRPEDSDPGGTWRFNQGKSSYDIFLERSLAAGAEGTPGAVAGQTGAKLRFSQRLSSGKLLEGTLEETVPGSGWTWEAVLSNGSRIRLRRQDDVMVSSFRPRSAQAWQRPRCADRRGLESQVMLDSHYFDRVPIDVLEDVEATPEFGDLVRQVHEISKESFYVDNEAIVDATRLDRDKHLTLMADKDRKTTLAYCLYNYQREKDRLWINQISVQHTMRAKGLGTSLLRWAAKQARKAGLVGLALWTGEESRGFYEKLGFAAVVGPRGQQKQSYITMEASVDLLLLGSGI